MTSPNENYCFQKASLLPGETTGGGGGVGTKSCVGGQVGAQRGWRSLCRNSWTVAGRRLQWGRWEEEIPFGALSPSSIGIARSIYPDATLGMEGSGVSYGRVWGPWGLRSLRFEGPRAVWSVWVSRHRHRAAVAHPAREPKPVPRLDSFEGSSNITPWTPHACESSRHELCCDDM